MKYRPQHGKEQFVYFIVFNKISSFSTDIVNMKFTEFQPYNLSYIRSCNHRIELIYLYFPPSCRSFVVITTLSTGLMGVEVTSVSWLEQLTVGV